MEEVVKRTRWEGRSPEHTARKSISGESRTQRVRVQCTSFVSIDGSVDVVQVTTMFGGCCEGRSGGRQPKANTESVDDRT